MPALAAISVAHRTRAPRCPVDQRAPRSFAAVDARFEGLVSWRGGQIDRLLDEHHAALVGRFADALAENGCHVHLEVTFSEYGERGSIDILAVRPSSSVALVVEIKTELTAIDDTIRRLDIKRRLCPKLVVERFDWRPASVSRLIVVLDRSTNRRRVAAHDGTLGRAFPDRGSILRRWLRTPIGQVSGLLFASPTNPDGTRRTIPQASRPQAARSRHLPTGLVRDMESKPGRAQPGPATTAISK